MSENTYNRKNELNGPSMVLLVADLDDSIRYYRELGFTLETAGGHVHMSRGRVTFILHPARNQEEIRPASAAEGGLYFDAFCYTHADDLMVMYEEFKAKDVNIVNGPNFDGWWKEFTIRDLNGYNIAFGGSSQE